MHSWTLLLGSKYKVYNIYLLRASADNINVINVMSRQSHTDLLHPNIHGNFVWIIIEITINPKGLDIISNNNLILPIFCRALIYYWIIIIFYWIIIIYYWIIIIY